MIKISSTQPKIIVVGSCSLDLVLYTDKIPHGNESVLASSCENYFGGKGANQAVATSRLGASVYFVGCVGMDPIGQQVMRNLVHENVNVGFVEETDKDATGTAYVTSSGGESAIVVVPAANKYISVQHIEHIDRYLQTTDLILLQLEIPLEVVEFTIKRAKQHGKKVGLYASPGKYLKEEIIDNLDFIVVKNSELSTVFDIEEKEQILKKYYNKVFIRDEHNSTIYYDGTEMKFFRNEKHKMIYKMGMGDAFISGFAIALCHDNSIEDCVKFGNEVSSHVSLGKGAQTRLPYLKDILGE